MVDTMRREKGILFGLAVCGISVCVGVIVSLILTGYVPGVVDKDAQYASYDANRGSTGGTPELPRP